MSIANKYLQTLTECRKCQTGKLMMVTRSRTLHNGKEQGVWIGSVCNSCNYENYQHRPVILRGSKDPFEILRTHISTNMAKELCIHCDHYCRKESITQCRKWHIKYMKEFVLDAKELKDEELVIYGGRDKLDEYLEKILQEYEDDYCNFYSGWVELPVSGNTQSKVG